MTRAFSGAGVAIVTPFDASGEIDEAAFRRLVRRQVEAGIDFLVPCGTTGESVTLSSAEQERVISLTLEESKGRPVVAGAGSNDTRAAVSKTKAACALGAQGILSVGPYYNKPTPEGFYRHFAAVADASTAPVLVYNVPGRTGSNIDNATMLRLARHGNIVAVKEASGNLGQVMDLIRDRPEGFGVLSGDDAFTLAMMALGGEGVISVAANQVPAEMHALTAAAAAGNWTEARRIHYRLLKLMNLNFLESNPVPVKASLAMLGLCEAQWRLPLCAPRTATEDALRAALVELGLMR